MNKKLRIIKSLNIEEAEVAPVLLLIIQSIFIGVFYGAFDIGAHTLFLKAYPESMIAKAYIISGVVGILLTGTFSKLQAKIPFSTLAKYTLLFVAILTMVMRMAFEFTGANWTIMVVFILLGPLNILAVLAFWGTVGRIFSLRQGKRLFGIIDAGQIFGIIISSFLIPLIIAYLNGTNNLLIISAVSIFIAMILEAVIVKRYKIDSDTEKADETEDKNEEAVKLLKFIKNPYILYMALFVIFSMFAAFFVQFSFLVVTNENYPAEQDLAKFLGYFNTVMMVFTLIIKTFVYSKLLKTYGLRVSLLLSSLLLALFTAVAVVSGFAGGFDIESTGFVYFFLFISLSKLFNKALKDSLEVPSFKILYQSLNKKIRYDIQAKIDGTVNEISALVSGVLLSILGFLAFVELIHYSVVLFVILVGWAYITFRLYKEYKGSLEEALSKEETSKHNNDISSSITLNELNNTIIRNYLPEYYPAILNNYFTNASPEKVKSFELVLEAFIINEFDKISEPWKRRLNEIDINENSTFLVNEISYAFTEQDLKKSAEAIRYIRKQSHNNQRALLAGMLRMPEVYTKRMSLKLCGYLNHIEMISTLAEFIDSDELMGETYIALQRLSGSGFRQLMQVYYRTDISELSQLIIIDILSNVNNEQDVIQFLFSCLSDHRYTIKNKAIDSLLKLNFRINTDNVHKMFPFIKDMAHLLAWDLATYFELDKEHESSKLISAFSNDLNNHKEWLFNLLRITYETNSVNHVYNYIKENSSESIGYGLELFDLFLSEEIKPFILLLFEEMSTDDKLIQLQEHFSLPDYSNKSVLEALINKDPNIISKTTKLLAMQSYAEQSNEVSDDIISQLFNSDEEIRDMAANVILKIDDILLYKVMERLDIRSKVRLKQRLESNNFRELFSHVFQLKEKIAETLDSVEVYESFNCSVYNYKNNYLNSIANDYFVFLKLDHFNKIHEIDNISLNYTTKSEIANTSEYTEQDGYVVGISKKNMNKLAICNKEYVQLLISKAL